MWLPLHIMLTGGYGLLTWLLWQAAARGDRHGLLRLHFASR